MRKIWNTSNWFKFFVFFSDGQGNRSDPGSDDDSDDDENTEQVTYTYDSSLSTSAVFQVKK